VFALIRSKRSGSIGRVELNSIRLCPRLEASPGVIRCRRLGEVREILNIHV
jgi:hypothetical protein